MMSQTRNGLNLSRRVGSWRLALALLLATAILSVPASAQVLYGSITGIVTDASNAAVPNVTVTVTNEANGETRSVTTGSSGVYLIQNLEAGPYTIEVKPFGNFGSYAQKNLPLSVSQEARVNIALQLASVKSEVTVTTAPAMLQTETAEVKAELSQAQISELPITSSQGRNFQTLYTLIPGAAAVQEQNSIGGNPARALSVNVNGVSYNTNTTRIDGAVNDYGWLPYLLAYLPPADSIQSVNVTTNSFTAEQGVAGGASIAITLKGGTNHYHGGVWEYYQDAKFNARGYTQSVAALTNPVTNPTGSIPKNIFHEFGANFGGPVYIPKLYKGKDKLFFFENFERITRRQLQTPQATVPTSAMIAGDFSAVSGVTTLYNPYTNADCTGPILPIGARTPFPGNIIPNTPNCRSTAAAKMLALLKPITDTITNPNYSGFLANDYTARGTFGYNRMTNDAKIIYNPSDKTSIFGRYSIEPYTLTDPQIFGGPGSAGGAAVDGGQPGEASGRIQNVGLGASHALTPNLVVDMDFGYTRQVTGAQSLVDIAAGDFGLNTLGIPGTNGPGINYVGQPIFAFTGFSTLGNASGANPFLFRDNQFTGDINVSWTKGKHATKYGYTYYHFDLNHFQPSVGSGVSNPRGGFMFQGSMTSNTSTVTAYNALADMLLGLPNNGTGIAVAKNEQLYNPNSLRWTEIGAYAQDQWTVSPKLTINYGIRYEIYPAPYTDKTGAFRLDPNQPQSSNIEVGGLGGNPRSAGIHAGHGQVVPRFGLVYRLSDRTVVRSGFGITTDPESFRFLRDQYPIEIAQAYVGTGAGTLSTDPSNNNAALTLTTGIPAAVTPVITNGFTSLPLAVGTNTTPDNVRRGYIESWNLFLQRDLGHSYIANLGYVGTHAVRQFSDITLNAAPLPSGSTTCMPNGQYNPSSGLTGACSFAANQVINQQHCNANSVIPGTNPVQKGYVCYNTGGITMNEPVFSANYNALQTQLTHNTRRNYQYGLVYTWSHAFDDADNGAGSGSSGPAYAYPTYTNLNRSQAGYDRTHNLQFWGIYHLPFGSGQHWATHGIASAIFGGFQITGQLSHVSGAPFTVSPSSSTINANGTTEYAQLVAPYHQLGGHARTPAKADGTPQSNISGGKPWFDPASFITPVEPQYTNPALPGYVNCSVPSCMVSPVLGNTRRNEFRGPGVTNVNASLSRSFHIYRESEFQFRLEAFNVANHVELVANPNVTQGPAGSTFGYITSFALGNNPAAQRSLQFSGRINF